MRILVYGFFGKMNIGDNLFVEAYCHLFPNYQFVFTDTIELDQLENIDAVFFGGGSFLLDKPLISDEAFIKLKGQKIFYLGVGVESEIHPIHLELMSLAKMIATRSLDQINRLKIINNNVIYIPDLVYSLQSKIILDDKSANSILIMPNINVVPQVSDPHWKHVAWAYFKSEFVQFMDWLVDNGYHPNFFAMCQGSKIDDNWASAELIGHMKHRNNFVYNLSHYTIEDLTKFISKYDLVITQRFHGIVLSEMTRTPYIAIHHHDKLRFSHPGDGTFLSYYNCSKQSFISAFQQTIKMNFTRTLPIESNIFEAFSKEVSNLI